MSPDLLVNEGGSSCLLPADMWAFGCTVLELVAGKRPWHECGFTHPPPLMLHIVRSQDVPQFPEGISPCLRDFLERCLARDPAQRMSIEQALKHPFLTGASFTPGQVDLGAADASARATQLRAHVQGISAHILLEPCAAKPVRVVRQDGHHQVPIQEVCIVPVCNSVCICM